MEQIKVNENLYKIPLGELYFNKFKNFVKDDVIDYELFNSLELEVQYKTKKELFNYLCDSLTLFNDSDNKYEELKEICSNIWRIDYMIKYLAQEKRC